MNISYQYCCASANTTINTTEYKWNWDIIYCSNKTIFDIPMKKIREYFAVKKIWRAWFRANTNPEYLICRNRLLKEFISHNHE